MSECSVRFVLQPHSTDGLAAAAASVAVELRCVPGADGLQIVYDVVAPGMPVLPPRAAAVPQRRDGLWRHTCCELFMAPAAGEGGYLEFNFSPSGDWAAYAFDAPRQGMRPFLWHAGVAPRIRQFSSVVNDTARSSSGPMHRLRVEVELPAPLPAGEYRLSPTVILETSAGLSHWAVRHCGERPDFHHPAGFSDPLALVWGSIA